MQCLSWLMATGNLDDERLWTKCPPAFVAKIAKQEQTHGGRAKRVGSRLNHTGTGLMPGLQLELGASVSFQGRALACDKCSVLPEGEPACDWSSPFSHALGCSKMALSQLPVMSICGGHQIQAELFLFTLSPGTSTPHKACHDV